MAGTHQSSTVLKVRISNLPTTLSQTRKRNNSRSHSGPFYELPSWLSKESAKALNKLLKMRHSSNKERDLKHQKSLNSTETPWLFQIALRHSTLRLKSCSTKSAEWPTPTFLSWGTSRSCLIASTMWLAGWWRNTRSDNGHFLSRLSHLAIEPQDKIWTVKKACDMKLQNRCFIRQFIPRCQRTSRNQSSKLSKSKDVHQWLKGKPRCTSNWQ